MSTKLYSLLQKDLITSLYSLRISREACADDFTLLISVQIDRQARFTTLAYTIRGQATLSQCFSRLLQAHIWNVPQDIHALAEWDTRFQHWSDGNDTELDLLLAHAEPLRFTRLSLARVS